MPRQREFDPDQALNTAILLFWEKGFFDASVDEVVKRSGVAKYGIYGTFGNKRALFRKVLAQYAEDRRKDIQAPIRKPDAALPEILQFFYSLPKKLTPKGGQYGCLMVNTGIELGNRDPEFSRLVKEFFMETTRVMNGCLERAIKMKQLKSGSSIKGLDKYLTTEFRAVLMLAASGHTRIEIKQHLDTALRVLR